MKNNLPYLFQTLLIILLFSGCTQMRSEFYRNETRYLYDMGCQDYKQGNYAAAESRLEELISMDPDYGPAYVVLGNLAMIDEAYERAYDYYTQAITHDPELEKEIMPFLIASHVQTARQPLIDSGVTLAMVYLLIMENRIDETQALLEGDIPLELLARDTTSLTPGQFQELRMKVTESALGWYDFPELQLLAAYLLFYSGENETVAEKLLTEIIKDSDGVTLQETYILMGRLQEQRSNIQAAVRNYLAAVDAGADMKAVAHHLARIYRIDIEAILPSPNKSQLTGTGSGEKQPIVHASSVGSSERQERTQQTDEMRFSLPIPEAVRTSESHD